MFDTFTSFGEKIARWVGDKTYFGIHPSSSHQNLIEYSIQHETLSNLLPFDAYDDETNIFYNKKSQGFLLEVAPLLGANEETVNILTSILTDVLPKYVDLQFILWGSDKIGDLLDSFERERSKRGDLFSWLSKKRTDFLKHGAHQSLSTTSQGSFIVRDFRLFLSVSIPASKVQNHSMDLMSLREAIKSTLKSIQMPSENVGIHDFISMMTDLLHPKEEVHPSKQNWNPYESLATQMTDPEYFIHVHKDRIVFEGSQEEVIKNNEIDKKSKENVERTEGNKKEKTNWEARSLTVKDLPSSMAQWKMTDAIGQLFNASLQIPCPFVIVFSIRIVDQDKAKLSTQMSALQKERSARSPLAKFMPLISKEHEEWRFVQNQLAEGGRLVESYFQITFFSKEDEADGVERKIKDLYRANGWRLKKTLYLQFQSFLAMLPMMMSEGMFSDLKRMGRIRTITAFNAANIAPLQGEWRGTLTPSLILPGRRGQIAYWNPFDNREGNFNFAVSAATGKGKSVFLNEYITAGLGAGDFISVIDNGHSYKKICKMFKGNYIEFDERFSISLNPFSFISDFNASLALIKPLFAAMAHPTTRSSDEEIAYLEKAAKAAWDAEGNEATITTVSNWLQKQSSAVCQNLSHLLYSYTKEGMYAKYFLGKSSIDFSNPFIVLELQALKSKKDLERIVLLLLMYQISERMYSGKREQRKSCIIDEAWDLFGGESDGAAKFIETGFRTARKYNANFATVVQSFNDYYKNAATITCLENSDTKIILGQTPETIDQIKKSEKLAMDPFTERLFKSLRKTDDYSECIIKSPGGLSVHRIILDPFSRVLYSSKAEEVHAVERLQNEGYSLQKAIEIVARKYHHGN